MHDFQRSNKVSGVYWLKKPIADVTIRIQLKYRENIINMPQFEQLPNTSGLQQLEDQKHEEYSFKWQEKVFNMWESNRYSDPHNCITDSELQYHEIVTQDDFKPSKVCTYISEDRYSVTSCVETEELASCFDKLDLSGRIGSMLNKDTVSMGNLFKSEEVLNQDHWVSMHVVLDNSDYNEDSQLLLKRESLLLSLAYNTTQRCLVLTPDMNHVEWNPYSVEGGRCLYGVGVAFKGGGDGELEGLLSKLHERWLKRHRLHLQFLTLPPGQWRCLVTLELLAASGFEMDHLHVEYHVRVPEGIRCEDQLRGRTHSARVMKTEEDGKQWLFGHLIELDLTLEAGLDPPPLKLYFEVISNDWWDIQRTEGYAHLHLPLTAGSNTRILDCIRPEEKNRSDAEHRRFFVGGCNLIEDLDVLGTPHSQNLNYRVVGTGAIKLRHSIITQAHLPGSTSIISATPGSSSDLLLGAEAVLTQYRKARARLAAATKDLDGDGIRSDEE